MTAKIILFPQVTQRLTSLKISLYTDDEIFLCILVLNSFGELPFKVTADNLLDIDPIYVISCLEKAKNSNLLSKQAKIMMADILATVEETYMDQSP